MPNDANLLAVYVTHRGDLVNYAHRLLNDRARAEDVVQEAFIRFNSTGAASALDEPLAYLYRIVRNLAFDATRRISAESRRDKVHQQDQAQTASRPTPEDTALYRDELRRVEAALAELPADQRRAFEMHRLGGLTFKDIAERLGVSTATAGRWTQQAHLHIAKRLRDSTG
ncbi:MAG: RNA polymerase subunit sigma-24 [Rhodospirillaceae bacterium]|nr:RNA polymerase subunit sigma-24 [Rhodospirillaceae bacterium]